jgi:hypothetical protein
MLSLTALSNIIQGVKVSKEKHGSKCTWQIRKGHMVIGEAYCNYSNEIEISMIRRMNPAGKGLMSLLLQEILNDSKRLNKDCKIEVKPFYDPNRPFETITEARKRVFNWYKQFGFEIQGINGIYKN